MSESGWQYDPEFRDGTLRIVEAGLARTPRARSRCPGEPHGYFFFLPFFLSFFLPFFLPFFFAMCFSFAWRIWTEPGDGDVGATDRRANPSGHYGASVTIAIWPSSTAASISA